MYAEDPSGAGSGAGERQPRRASDDASDDSSLERVAADIAASVLVGGASGPLRRPVLLPIRSASASRPVPSSTSFTIDPNLQWQLQEVAHLQRSRVRAATPIRADDRDKAVDFGALGPPTSTDGVSTTTSSGFDMGGLSDPVPRQEHFIDKVIPNLRDLAVSSCMENLKVSQLFRSARPFGSNLTALYSVFVRVLGVKYIIDLRDSDLSAVPAENVARHLISKIYRQVLVPTVKLSPPSTPVNERQTGAAESSNVRQRSAQTRTTREPDEDPQSGDGAEEDDPLDFSDVTTQETAKPSSSPATPGNGQPRQQMPPTKSAPYLQSTLSPPQQLRSVTEVQRLVKALGTKGWWNLIPESTRTEMLEHEHKGGLLHCLSSFSANERTAFIVNILDSEIVRRRVLQEVTTSPLLPMMVLYRVTDKLTGSALAPYYFCKYFMSMHDIFESYVEMLSCCGSNFATALKLIAIVDGPVLFHCSLGKDRTGILSMLLLWILGATESMILFDYSLTEMAGETYQKYNRKFITEYSGLSPGFCSSNVETMRRTLDYIKIKWGSMDAYLDAIGLTWEWRNHLRQKYLKNPACCVEGCPH